MKKLSGIFLKNFSKLFRKKIEYFRILCLLKPTERIFWKLLKNFSIFQNLMKIFLVSSAVFKGGFQFLGELKNVIFLSHGLEKSRLSQHLYSFE